MRVKIDENMGRTIARWFTDRGVDACTIAEQGLSGTSDEFLIPRLLQESRVLVTLDVKLADLRRFPLGTHAGIVLLRPGRPGRSSVLHLLETRGESLLRTELVGRVTVVDSDTIRQRVAGGASS